MWSSCIEVEEGATLAWMVLSIVVESRELWVPPNIAKSPNT